MPINPQRRAVASGMPAHISGKLAPMRQSVLAKVNANCCAWRYFLGEVDGDRARPAPAVNESHSRAQMRREKRTNLTGAAGEYGAAKFVVYLIRALGTRPWIGHAHLPPISSTMLPVGGFDPSG